MANKIDYVYAAFPINISIDYDEWYIMKSIVRNGIVKAFVDDIQICASESAFPTGEYREPHLTVRYGDALFGYVKVCVRSS